MNPSIEPFNAKKYKQLMDGLECIEVPLSMVNVDNEKYRFDSEFFSKKYIEAYKKIKEIPHSTIGKELDVLTDFHSNGSYQDIATVFELLDKPDYAYMVRTTDLEKRDYVTNVKYVSKLTYDFLAKSKVYGGEVIINKIGSPGRTFLMPNLKRPVSLGMNQFMLRMKKNGNIDNACLYIFLNSRIGKLLIDRKVNGTVPLTIDKKAVRSIYVPILSHNLRQCITQAVDSANDLFNSSDENYYESVAMLTNYFSFNITELSVKGTTEKKLSESFDATGRLDAEYYQPQYDDLFSLLNKLPTKKLGEIVDIKKSIEPGSEYYGSEGVPFIRVSDISAKGIKTPSIRVPRTLVPSIESLYPKKDTILFSKDGSIGIAYKMEKDIEAITAGALLHLRVKHPDKVLPDYLTLVLNSKIVHLQAERNSNGSVIQHWKTKDIANTIIPVLSIDKQRLITEKVQKSFALQHKAEMLVETAIKTVELAIEYDEIKAINYIKNNEIGLCCP